MWDDYMRTIRRNRKKMEMSKRLYVIACIALSRNAILIMHNLKDFQRVLNLTPEDWVD